MRRFFQSRDCTNLLLDTPCNHRISHCSQLFAHPPTVFPMGDFLLGGPLGGELTYYYGFVVIVWLTEDSKSYYLITYIGICSIPGPASGLAVA
jgi:hypothetical protein